MMKKLLSTSLLSTTLLIGCGHVPPADIDGCEHLRSGPATMVTASATTSEAPAVRNDHRRYDIALVATTGGKGGSVRFAAPKASDYVLFLGSNVPVKVLDASGTQVPFEASATSSKVCGEVKGRHALPLKNEMYILTFGPTSESSVSLVIEEDVDDGHGH
jgi:hypothetical protein